MNSKNLNLTIRSLDEAQRSVDCVASTNEIDSYGESVAQNWRLERYRSNPVVLFAHESRKLPIGRAENVRVESGKLMCRIVFATAAGNPLAENVWELVRTKVLRAVSVGFRPHSFRTEVRDGQEVTILDDNELYEISVTPVPANPEALMRAAGGSPKSGAISTVEFNAPTPVVSDTIVSSLESLKASNMLPPGCRPIERSGQTIWQFLGANGAVDVEYVGSTSPPPPLTPAAARAHDAPSSLGDFMIDHEPELEEVFGYPEQHAAQNARDAEAAALQRQRATAYAQGGIVALRQVEDAALDAAVARKLAAMPVESGAALGELLDAASDADDDVMLRELLTSPVVATQRPEPVARRAALRLDDGGAELGTLYNATANDADADDAPPDLGALLEATMNDGGL